ncbi:MAG: RimK family protein [Salinisphaeraceae bacterium]|nr:RimK family protein [Salinisphaeraceae bacterium]
MSSLLIVVDRLKDWKAYYPTSYVIAINDYLHPTDASKQRVRVINLARDYSYLSEGYYCSLLAEARGHAVLPSVATLNELNSKTRFSGSTEQIQRLIGELPGQPGQVLKSNIYFGLAEQPELQALAAEIYDQYPCPILRIQLRYKDGWQLAGISAGALHKLSDPQQDKFADALNRFSRKIWRKPQTRKPFRYELAILINPAEKLPPSNRKALSHFRRAGRQLGLDVAFIGPKDLHRVAEFDALFIRETTSPNDHTYRFAQRAAAEQMVVIDDPTSIMRCTNKVYLDNLLQSRKIPAPKSRILNKDRPEQLEAAASELGLPLVLKIPDGSFSRGVERIESLDELKTKATEFFKHSALVLAQEYVYTEYDWRIGMLDGQPLYACKYYMSRGHWQIYQHNAKGQTRSGDFETLPLDAVPAKVLKAARNISQPIGRGLYGVDIKQSGDKIYVIEVNDNPSIDAGVEDVVLGQQLYEAIMRWFLNQLDTSRGNQAASQPTLANLL